MEKLIWTDAIQVGNRHIDDQHKYLFELTNNLIEHSNAKVCDKIIRDTLHDLLQYTRYHFEEEEILMQTIRFPKITEHKTEHEDFLTQVAMFCKDVLDGKNSISNEIIDFLGSWLVKHTSGSDLEIKKHLDASS